jgi:cell division protein ZapA (FtsZ GTPase activity inhibitor)
MPEVQIEIGGRSYTVACQDGEETFLRAAAKMLDTEATVVLGQIGRMPSDRMLLMAGLMLADKTAAQEDELKSLRPRSRPRTRRCALPRNGSPTARAASRSCRRRARAPNCPTASPTDWLNWPRGPRRSPTNWRAPANLGAGIPFIFPKIRKKPTPPTGAVRENQAPANSGAKKPRGLLAGGGQHRLVLPGIEPRAGGRGHRAGLQQMHLGPVFRRLRGPGPDQRALGGLGHGIGTGEFLVPDIVEEHGLRRLGQGDQRLHIRDQAREHADIRGDVPVEILDLDLRRGRQRA